MRARWRSRGFQARYLLYVLGALVFVWAFGATTPLLSNLTFHDRRFVMSAVILVGVLVVFLLRWRRRS